MIRAYLVDDEPLAVQRLSRLLVATGRVDIVGSTTEPQSALEYLRARSVDVLFLDVQMPELTGFDLIQQLELPPLVVFTTAYDRYALDAFEANSIDYLLKPVEPDRLQRTLDRVERMAGASHRAASGSHVPGDLHALARELAAQLAPQRAPDRIASQSGERVVLLDLARVTHFVSRDKLTFAVVNGREHVVDRTLAELEATLDGRRFVRIHRATIVNVAAVHEIDRWVDGGVLVRLNDEKKTELSVARDRVRELKRRLGI
jgi:two-component system LytT family response regulator